LQEQDSVKGATREFGYRLQLRKIALDELQARRLRTHKSPAYVDTNGGGCTVFDKFRELAAVTATNIKYGPPSDVTQKRALRRPLDKPIQRVLPSARPLVITSEL
jgi:hypothetical protein